MGGGWVWGNVDVIFRVGMRKCWHLLTSADKVSGSKKGQKHADIILEWSLIATFNYSTIKMNLIFSLYTYTIKLRIKMLYREVCWWWSSPRPPGNPGETRLTLTGFSQIKQISGSSSHTEVEFSAVITTDFASSARKTAAAGFWWIFGCSIIDEPLSKHSVSHNFIAPLIIRIESHP